MGKRRGRMGGGARIGAMAALLLLLLALLAWPGAALAHTGAPYPVLLEEPAGPYLVSALADPDVGEGTFYVQVALADGGPVPAGTRLSLRTWPDDGHLPAAAYEGARDDTRYGERFVVEVPFDATGTWQVELAVDGPAGQGQAAFGVEVTPAGINWLTTVACLVPFVLAALVWLRATLRRRPPAEDPGT